MKEKMKVSQDRPCGYFRPLPYLIICGGGGIGGCSRKPSSKKDPGETRCKGVIADCDYYKRLKG
jgi:hypothetical protein